MSLLLDRRKVEFYNEKMQMIVKLII